MLTVYLCFLAGGMVLPLFNLVMGVFSNSIDSDVDTDIDIGTDVEFDTQLDIETDMDFNVDTDIGLDTEVDLDTDIDMDTDVDMDTVIDLSTDSNVNTRLDAGADRNVDSNGFAISLIPTSLLSLSALAITFGAAGAIMTIRGTGWLITIILAVLIGYFSAVMIQSIIKSLKRIQTRSFGINENELLLYEGKIIDTILPGQLGSVSFVTLKNVRVSYPARCDDVTMKINAGRVVKAKEFRDGIFIVEPKNKYESNANGI